ncbi:MAG: dihydrodipicolinate synthase family protein, partial [Acidiferrobacteraceae bacterium]|nr:dihydrodipicolinate synthase family protein [Acidiferrobacteraceae bacterium]
MINKRDNKGATGVWCASLTPLNSDLSIDLIHLIDHIQFLLDNGIHGIGLFGTTGEATSFSTSERMVTLEGLLRRGIPKDTLMVGTGCSALTDTTELTKHAIECGVTKVLTLPPFYYKNVSDSGLFESFSEIIDRTQSDLLELYLYHFPIMSQVPISVDLIAKLQKKFPNIIAGVKDSSGDLKHTLNLTDQFPDLAILPGNETHLLAALNHGATGCISATANANPQGIRSIFDGWINQENDIEPLQARALAIRNAFGKHQLVSALKQFASWSTRDDSWLRFRPPLRELEPSESAIL